MTAYSILQSLCQKYLDWECTCTNLHQPHVDELLFKDHTHVYVYLRKHVYMNVCKCIFVELYKTLLWKIPGHLQTLVTKKSKPACIPLSRFSQIFADIRPVLLRSTPTSGCSKAGDHGDSAQRPQGPPTCVAPLASGSE